jgi:hypothetical protein
MHFLNLLHRVFRMATSAPSTSPTVAPAPAPAPSNAEPPKGAYGGIIAFLKQLRDIFSKFIDTNLLAIAPELGHLAPIIFTFGTAFFALISFNYPLAVFAASGAEASILYSVFTAVGDALAVPTEQPASKEGCTSKFEVLTPARFAFSLRGQTFPNSPLYFLSFAASYLITSMSSYTEELTAMGPQYSSRPFIALIGAAMLIVLYAAYVLAKGCDSLLSVGVSILIGIFVGYMISSQNLLLLGKPSISVLFIPPLVDKENMDYLCVKA